MRILKDFQIKAFQSFSFRRFSKVFKDVQKQIKDFQRFSKIKKTNLANSQRISKLSCRQSIHIAFGMLEQKLLREVTLVLCVTFVFG